MLRILLIDDDDVTRLLMRHLLEDAAYEVHETNSGEVALSMLQQESFDLVITDLLMPAKDGLQTILEIQRLPRKHKIIAVSSGGPTCSPRLLNIAKSYGAVQTLLKPLSADTFLTAVREVLEQS